MTDGGNSISVLLDENVDRQVLAYLRAEGHGSAYRSIGTGRFGLTAPIVPVDPGGRGLLETAG